MEQVRLLPLRLSEVPVAKMVGKACWWNSGCACCCGPRSRKSQKQREKRMWRREADSL